MGAQLTEYKLRNAKFYAAQAMIASSNLNRFLEIQDERSLHELQTFLQGEVYRYELDIKRLEGGQNE